MYRGYPQDVIKDLIVNQKKDILEEYVANILTTGDALPIPLNLQKL